MKPNKQIINISDVVSNIPNVTTMTFSEFVTSISEINTNDNTIIYCRSSVTTQDILFIVDNFNSAVCYMPDFSESAINDDSSIKTLIQQLETEEMDYKLTQLVNITNTISSVQKLIRLAQCKASSFGEKRNAVNAAYRLVFGV